MAEEHKASVKIGEIVFPEVSLEAQVYFPRNGEKEEHV